MQSVQTLNSAVESAVESEYLLELARTSSAMEKKQEFRGKEIHRLPKDIRLILAPERKQRQALKQRSPRQWLIAIQAIRNPDLRQRVACIVWWDYFAHRTITERWPHLDRWLEMEKIPSVPLAEIRLALYRIGYTALQAETRVHDSYYSVNGINNRRIYKTNNNDDDDN